MYKHLSKKYIPHVGAKIYELFKKDKICHFKGTVSRDFYAFYQKTTWAPYEQAKEVLHNFHFCKDILEKCVSA